MCKNTCKRSMNPARVILYCAAISILPAQISNSAPVLHIYREKGEMGVISRPTVSCDNFPLARIPNGRLYTIKVSPGWHEIGTTDKPAPIRIDVKADNEYFVRIDYPLNSAFSLGATPVLVPTEQGRREIAGLRPLEGRYIEAGSCGR